MGLIFNVFPHYIGSYFVTLARHKIPITTKFTSPKLSPQFRKLLQYFSNRYALQYLNHLRWRALWGYLHEYMRVSFYHFHRIYRKSIILGYLLKDLFQILLNLNIQHMFPIFAYTDQVIFKTIYSVLCPSDAHIAFMQENVLIGQAFSSSPYGERLSSHQRAGGYPAELSTKFSHCRSKSFTLYILR